MSFASQIFDGPMPRPMLWAGAPALAVVLISLFVFLGFPYDRLSDQIASSARDMTGADVTIVDLYPRITIAGPGLGAEIVSVTTGAQQHFELGPVGLRPAWSLSWFTGRPAVYVDVGSVIGNLEGTLTVGSNMEFDGELTDCDLSLLPLSPGAPFSLTGIATAQAELVFDEANLTGPLTFHAVNGSVRHNALPIPLDFEDFKGDLVLGTNPMAEINEATFVGPIVTAAVAGKIESDGGLRSANLDLDMVVEIKNPAILMLLQGMGIELDDAGAASFAVTGPITRPQIR